MGDRYKPVIVGVVTGLLLLVLPDGLGPVVLMVAAVLAGWVLAEEPMTAALLFLAPAVVLGTVRLLADHDAPSIGALVLSFVLAVFLAAILTHAGAGMALRRRPGASR